MTGATRPSATAPAERVRRIGLVESTVFSAGALVAAVILGLTLNSSATFQRDLPLAEGAQSIKENLTLSHLWLEEYLGGDASINLDKEVFANIDAAGDTCQELRAGSGIPLGPGTPASDAAGMSSMRLCAGIENFNRLAERRLANPRNAAIGTATDQAYDDAFRTLLVRANRDQQTLRRTLLDHQAQQRRLGMGFALLVLAAAAGMALALGRHRRLLVAKNSELAGLGSIVQSSGDAIIAMSVDGTVESWNSGAESLLGHSADRIVGRHVTELTPTEADAGRLEAALEAVRGGEPVDGYEADWLRADGSVVPAAFSFSPMFDADVLQAVSAIGQNITQRRAAQAELELARGQALESSRMKSEFLATMSHEIRTPMNGVIGLNRLLLETPLDETQRQYAEGVRGAGEALLSVINDILDFSKLEAGKVDLEIGDVDPRQLVEEIASLLAVAAHGKGLELIAHCQPDVPGVLVGDGGRLRQVLLNLASNAVKFTAAGEVAIKVRVAAGGAGEVMLRFEVADTGIGVPVADLERLFESFSQADASTTRRYGGTGLGLAISRRLVEAMGGTIGADSAAGKGSTFWFQVPLPVAVDAPADRAPQMPGTLTGLSVLVVDDNATNRLVLESQLAGWRMRPDAVSDAQSALARLREAVAADQPFDVAVLDMCMPEMDGLELARAISTDPTLSSTRLIMLTSTMNIDAEQLKQAGVAQWLTKPVRGSEFYDRLMRLMAPAAAVSLPTQQSVPRTAAAASLGRVLVVEDNSLNQLVAEGVLTKLGYQVDIVAHGADALEAISATAYAAVLMDCHMPVMDGFEATRTIRAQETGDEHIPIVAMTAGAMTEDRERCLAAGMDDYVSKPVDVSALAATMTRWVRPQPAAAAPVMADGQPAQPEGHGSAIDLQRQSVPKALGPDDG